MARTLKRKSPRKSPRSTTGGLTLPGIYIRPTQMPKLESFTPSPMMPALESFTPSPKRKSTKKRTRKSRSPKRSPLVRRIKSSRSPSPKRRKIVQ
jgi:hypothetical protein